MLKFSVKKKFQHILFEIIIKKLKRIKEKNNELKQ